MRKMLIQKEMIGKLIYLVISNLLQNLAQLARFFLLIFSHKEKTRREPRQINGIKEEESRVRGTTINGRKETRDVQNEVVCSRVLADFNSL